MNYYKVVNRNGHNGMHYTEGVNVDIQEFYPYGDCTGGGIYFSREDIFAFIDYGDQVYKVNPIGEVYENPGRPKKWKAHAVDLTYIGRIDDIETIKKLVEDGAIIDVGDGKALRWACGNGKQFFPIVKYLVEQGAYVGALRNYPLTLACREGHLPTVKFLVDNGADIHADSGAPIKMAAEYGRTEIVEYLIEKGADIHVGTDYPVRWAIIGGYLDTVKCLIKHGADWQTAKDTCMRQMPDSYRQICRYTDILEYLRSLEPEKVS